MGMIKSFWVALTLVSSLVKLATRFILVNNYNPLLGPRDSVI